MEPRWRQFWWAAFFKDFLIRHIYIYIYMSECVAVGPRICLGNPRLTEMKSQLSTQCREPKLYFENRWFLKEIVDSIGNCWCIQAVTDLRVVCLKTMRIFGQCEDFAACWSQNAVLSKHFQGFEPQTCNCQTLKNNLFRTLRGQGHHPRLLEILFFWFIGSYRCLARNVESIGTVQHLDSQCCEHGARFQYARGAEHAL